MKISITVNVEIFLYIKMYQKFQKYVHISNAGKLIPTEKNLFEYDKNVANIFNNKGYCVK